VNELMLRSDGTVAGLGEFDAVFVPPHAVAMIAIKLALAVNVKRLKSMGLSSRCSSFPVPSSRLFRGESAPANRSHSAALADAPPG
jgi:hypothetical protein